MTVKRSDGTTVPFLPIKESGDINSYWMSYDEYAALPEVFCQRNTEGRLSKAIKHLSKLLRKGKILTSVIAIFRIDAIGY